MSHGFLIASNFHEHDFINDPNILVMNITKMI